MWTVFWVAVKDAAQLLNHPAALVHTVSMEQHTYPFFDSFTFGCAKNPDPAGSRPARYNETIGGIRRRSVVYGSFILRPGVFALPPDGPELAH